jgi:FMN phosphatase YigB (HAD superfamily)
MIKRIRIASDFLMTKEKEQFSNRRWMSDILSRPILRATGLQLETLASLRNDPKQINRKAFFAASGIDVDLDKTQFWYDDRQISAESIALLEPFIDPTDLVIGYELSDQTRAILDRMGVAWVDVWLHPVRFMDDVLFAFNASDPSVRARFFEHDVPPEQMALYADRIRVQTYKGWKRVEANVTPNSALFVGQMMNDKSVICDGHMLTLLDFKDQFEEILGNYAKVYYARHPYMKNGDEKILEYVKSHPKMEMATEASYRILSNNRIRAVFSLSSSVIEEAKYFGKETSYLYKPVVCYGDPRDPKSSATLMQDFVSPRFWAKALAPIMETDPGAPHVGFIDPKDKIRDMLGFYWSYHDIDKTENMRRRLTDVMRPQEAQTKKTEPKAKEKPSYQTPPKGFVNNVSDILSLKAEIDRHEIISFDVFDTLIERIVFHPNDMFEFMIPEVEAMLGRPFPDFPEARRKARNLALDKANGEEVLLKHRYDALAEGHGLNPKDARMLETIEHETEKRVCRPREVGLKAMHYALERGKRVILISDTFFERHVVEDLLERCGVNGWHRLYLSSEEGVLKHTGRLFDHVRSEEKVKPGRILHIGDNVKADIEMAKIRGFSSFHLEDKERISGKFGNTMKALDKIGDFHTRSLVKGLVARKLADYSEEEKLGATFGDPDVLGYALMGVAFSGFALWILDRAKKEGVTDLYFLARDGDIAKRCYDILTKGEEAPRSHYLYASRRAVSVAGIFGKEEVQILLERNFSPCPIGRLLEARFGLDPRDLPSGAFSDYGFGSPAGLADWRTGKIKIRAFFSDPRILEPIIFNAKIERELLMKVYRDAGLGDPDRRIGFVDIGHSGTLQAAITKLLCLKDTRGFYFATKEDAPDTVGDGHVTEGYVIDKYKDSERENPYRKHIIMYELMFQNLEGSFICYQENRGRIIPLHLSLVGEDVRITMIKRVHDSACAFAEELYRTAAELRSKLVLEGPESISAMSAMLHNPSPQDAAIFRGISFENRYSARENVSILPHKGGAGLWAEAREEHIPGGFVSRAIQSIATRVTPPGKKREKLTRDPRRFFAESQYLAIRFLAQFISE